MIPSLMGAGRIFTISCSDIIYLSSTSCQKSCYCSSYILKTDFTLIFILSFNFAYKVFFRGILDDYPNNQNNLGIP